MSKITKAAKLIASDARSALATKRSCALVVLSVDYGVAPCDELTAELRTMLPGVEIKQGKDVYRFRKAEV